MSVERWTRGHLSDVVSRLDAGVSVNSTDVPAQGGDIGVLKTSAVYGGVFKPQENKTVVAGERRRVATPVEGESIIVSRMNTPDLVGESAFVQDDHPHLFLPDRLWQLRFKNRDGVCVRWLSFVLSSPMTKSYVKLNATGTSGSMKNLPKARLLALPVDFPPIPEQRRIAEILDTLDEAIRRTEQVIAKLQQMKQGLLHDLLTRGIDEHGELRDPERHPEQFKDSPLGRIPRGWKVRRVEDAGSVRLGRQRAPVHQTGRHVVPYLRVANVHDGHFKLDDVLSMNFSPPEQDRYSVLPGDVLLNEGQSLELVGRCALYEGLPGRYCFQNTLVRFRPAPDTTDPRFARSVFKRWLDTGRFMQIAKQTTSIAHLGADRFAKMQFPLPPTAEQRRVTQVLRNDDARAVEEKRHATKLRTLKQGLMDDLLTGRVRVTVPEDAA